MGQLTLSDGTSLSWSSMLIEDYVNASEIQGGQPPSAISTTEGYALTYIGGSGIAQLLMPDSSNETGWVQVAASDTILPGDVAGISWEEGVVVLYASGPDLSGPDLNVASYDGNQLGDWASVTAPDEVQHPITNIVSTAVGNTPAIVVVTSDGSSATAWHLSSDATDGPWTRVGEVTGGAIAPATVEGTAGLVTLVPNQEDPSTADLIFFPAPFGTETSRVLASGISANFIAAATGATGSSFVFVADNGYGSGKSSLSYIDASSLASGLQKVASDVMIMGLEAGLVGPDLEPTVFATGVDGKLYVWRPGITEGDGNRLFDLELPLQVACTAQDAGGTTELIGVDAPADRLRRIFESEDGWNIDDIELPKGPLQGQFGYSTVLTLFDANGAAMPNAPAQVYADAVTVARVGNSNGVIGPNAPMATTTDPSGRLRVTIPTASLSTCRLRVVAVEGEKVRSMADGEQWLTPADTVRTRLRQLSAADVKKLAPGATNADAILAALQSVGNASYEDDSDLLHAAVPHAWRLTIDVERNASFRELSAEEAATAFAGLDLGKVSGWGWSDFVDTFEEAIDNLASEAKDIALNFDVQKAVEVGLEIALSLTVGGHLWTTAGKAETFEEAAEVASAILSAAEAKFEDLVDFFGWLLDEAKDDIWRTKNAIHDLFRQAPDELIKLVQDASAVSASFFAAQEQWLDSQFQTLIDQIGQEPLDPPALAAGAEGTPISDALDEWDAAASWLWDQILGQADGLTKDFAFSTDLINKISNFIQELGTDCVDKVQARMDSFLQALDSYASNAQNLETLLLKTLLELVKDVLLAILDLVDTVTHDFLSLIQLVLQAVGEVFDAPIGGVLQDLYDLMNTGAEETATVAGFAALMLAAPATVVYRAVEGAAPFSEELATADAQPSTWLILAGCATASLWAPMDAYLDFRVLPETGPGPLDKLVNVCGANLIPIGLQLMCWPKGPFTPPVLNTVQDKADWAAWGCGWGPMGFNLMVTVYRRLAGTARGKQWAWMLALLGFVATGANIIKVGKETIDGNTNAYDWILAFSAPLPVMAKPLAFVPGWGQTLLLLCDFVGDGATAVARIQKGEAMHDV